MKTHTGIGRADGRVDKYSDMAKLVIEASSIATDGSTITLPSDVHVTVFVASMPVEEWSEP